MASFMDDRSFLLKVNKHKTRTYYAAIMCLDFETEKPIARLEGKVVSGNINVAANSSTRRTASFQLIFDKDTYNITDVNNLIAIDKKISLSIGLANPFYHTEEYRKYGDVLWFKQGVFAIISASSSISNSGLSVSINLNDKMSFLNGTCGGTLPACVNFHEIAVIDADENMTLEYPIIRQIITECVNHFGGEHFSRISVEDVPSTGRIVLEFNGGTPINFATVEDPNSPTGYTRAGGASFVIQPPPVEGYDEVYIKGDKVGYKETPLTYPGELIMKAGATVTQVLDEIVKALGNYEYFYDVEGIFHFRKKKNFQATGMTPLNLYPEEDAALQSGYCPRYSPSMLLNEFSDAELVSSISFSPNYSNIKNDFIYFGTRKNDKSDVETMVRYHLAIDTRPEDIPIPEGDDVAIIGDNYSLCHKDIYVIKDLTERTIKRYQFDLDNYNSNNEVKELYAPALDVLFPDNPSAWFNWREELYRRALVNYGASTSGSYYDEELMAEWRNIFDPTSDDFKKGWEDKYGIDNPGAPWTGYIVDAKAAPEKLRYWLDLLDTNGEFGKYSVSRIGRRSIVKEDSKINEVFSQEVNDIIFIEMPTDEREWEQVLQRVREEYIPIGQTYAFVQKDLWKYFKEVNSYGTCYEGVRGLLYSNLIYNSSVSLNCIPILYLDGDQAIRLNFPDKGVTGDYIINSISFSFSQSPTMTIQCQQAMVIN